MSFSSTLPPSWVKENGLELRQTLGVVHRIVGPDDDVMDVDRSCMRAYSAMACAWTSSPKQARNISPPTMSGRSGEVAARRDEGQALVLGTAGAEASAKGSVAMADAFATIPSIETARFAPVAASLRSFLVSMAVTSIVLPPRRPPASLISLALSLAPLSDGRRSKRRVHRR